jgi:lipoprotein-anchoring transpeptidase ErfK/SrfK
MYSHYRPIQQKKPQKHRLRHGLVALVMLSAVTAYVWHVRVHHHTVSAATAKPAATATVTQKPSTPCSGNTAHKLIIVSISGRHLWACAGSSQQYDSPVVTGQQKLAADLTPTGTYQIYGKQTNLYLAGSDSTGSWNDYVYYWMPFLHNQYGTYGFHDATWRDNSAFGNIDPYSSQGSHGCVELPLATAKWLYSWAENGTTVNIVA